MSRRSLTYLFLLISIAACGGGAMRDSIPEMKRRVGIMWQSVRSDSSPCDWIEMFDGVQSPALAFVWRSYGDTDYCLIDFIDRHGAPTFHVYATNGVCIRKGNCSEVEAQTLTEVINYSLEALGWMRLLCPDCPIEIVPQLEDNLSEEEACHVVSKIREGAYLMGHDNFTVGRNPVSSNQVGNRGDCYDFVELHNSEANLLDRSRPCTYSNDGRDLEVGDTLWALPDAISLTELRDRLQQFASCDVYIWTADSNCLSTDTKQAPFPNLRDCSRMDSGTIDELNQLMKELQ